MARSAIRVRSVRLILSETNGKFASSQWNCDVSVPTRAQSRKPLYHYDNNIFSDCELSTRNNSLSTPTDRRKRAFKVRDCFHRLFSLSCRAIYTKIYLGRENFDVFICIQWRIDLFESYYHYLILNLSIRPNEVCKTYPSLYIKFHHCLERCNCSIPPTSWSFLNRAWGYF